MKKNLIAISVDMKTKLPCSERREGHRFSFNIMYKAFILENVKKVGYF